MVNILREFGPAAVVWCRRSGWVSAVMLASYSTALASSEIYFESSGARLNGRISVVESSPQQPTNSGGGGMKVATLHLETPITVPRQSAYPDDACLKDTRELQLLGEFDYARFTRCPVAVTGVMQLDQTGCIRASILVKKLECMDTGEVAGAVPPDFSWKNERKDRYACSPHQAPELFIAKFLPMEFVYSDREGWSPSVWIAAEHIMRSSPELRFSEDSLNAMMRDQATAISRLWTAFPESKGAAMETEYLPYALEVRLVPRVQAEVEERAREISPRQGTRRLQPLPAGFGDLCSAVCTCWLWRTPEGANRMVFAPTTNLFAVMRRLRESPDVAAVHLVKDPWYLDRTRRKHLLVRRTPSGFRFTLEYPVPLSGERMTDYFEVDESGARRATPRSQAELLAFKPDPLPADFWQ